LPEAVECVRHKSSRRPGRTGAEPFPRLTSRDRMASLSTTNIPMATDPFCSLPASRHQWPFAAGASMHVPPIQGRTESSVRTQNLSARGPLRLTTLRSQGASGGPGYSLSRTPQPHQRFLRLSCILRPSAKSRSNCGPDIFDIFRYQPFVLHSGCPAASRHRLCCVDGFLVCCCMVGLQHLAEVLHIVALTVLLRPPLDFGVVALNSFLQEGLPRLFRSLGGSCKMQRENSEGCNLHRRLLV
jgi:hypothetical protein